jgi:hypothetical protein
MFGEGADALVWRVGTGIRPITWLKLNVEFDDRVGYYGNTNGIIADLTCDIDKKSQVSAGIDYDVYQRDSMTGQEIARRYWVAGKYKVAKHMAVSGRLQDDVNVTYTRNISGRLVFDYDF